MPAAIIEQSFMDEDSLPSSSNNSIFKTPKLPKRKSTETSKSKDVVAMFTHSELVNPAKTKFVRHKSRSGHVVYSIKKSGAQLVRHVGLPVNDDDFEYVVAKVSKKTHRPIELRPATLVKFEAMSNANEVIKGTADKKPTVNYNADFSIGTEAFAQKRKDLIAQFGSAKKNKIQEAALRRRITEDTLSVMTSSAFASPTAPTESKSIIKIEDAKPDQHGSMVLPKPNLDAQIPVDVYPLSMFRSKEDVERYGKTAVAYFNQHETEDKLIKSGVPVFLVHRIGNIEKASNVEDKAFLALKMITMAKFIMLLNANTRKKTISFDDLVDFKLPESFAMMIRTEFFSEKLQGKRFGVTSIDREKILAHFICLALVYDPINLELPITPICLELHTTEKKVSGILEALGCIISQGSAAEQDRLKTLRIAHLIGPPREKRVMRGKRKTL